MLLRLAYLGVTNAFAMLRLLPMTDRDKDAEILALRLRLPRMSSALVGGLPRDWRPSVPGLESALSRSG
ncbi:hypothetical protein SVIO_102980 [Streptomyces violaceusniger]|uniref:Uncharacterized protein n=1 Tax=Streptomyces violaceusniger TaxID=68280 RepID=A0A4D4LFA0_STRVO|nr:hypothetical protein SVIO_102980 [Streptomyces violaceusniger]